MKFPHICEFFSCLVYLAGRIGCFWVVFPVLLWHWRAVATLILGLASPRHLQAKPSSRRRATLGVTGPRHLHTRPISRRRTHFEGDQTPPHPPGPWASRMAHARCRAHQTNCLMRCSGAVSPGDKSGLSLVYVWSKCGLSVVQVWSKCGLTLVHI